MALQEARRAGAQGSASAGQMERGMASFVRQTITMYRGGFDSRRMLLTVRRALCSSASSACRDVHPKHCGLAWESMEAAVGKCIPPMSEPVTTSKQGKTVFAWGCNGVAAA